MQGGIGGSGNKPLHDGEKVMCIEYLGFFEDHLVLKIGENIIGIDSTALTIGLPCIIFFLILFAYILISELFMVVKKK